MQKALSYPNCKYKRAIWSKLGKVGSDKEPGKEFEDQLAKGYPKTTEMKMLLKVHLTL